MILGLGIANLGAVLTMAVLLVTLMLRQDRRIDQMEQRIGRRFDLMEERLQRLEQGQARVEGEMAVIREVLFARPPAGD